MLRGDMQGGQSVGNMYSQSNPNGLPGGNLAIEKYMRWSWSFFLAALIVFGSGVGTAVYWLTRPTWAPGTFVTEIFLIFFGLIMIVLDWPQSEHPTAAFAKHFQAVRMHIYKFVLFMTRFTGRGAWYLFLATMVFGELYDAGVNWFLGGVFTLYLVTLGGIAIFKGIVLTQKLQRIRDAIVDSGKGVEHFIARDQTGLSREQFKAMILNVTNEEPFNNDEVDYVMSALAFTPEQPGHVTVEECGYWLGQGPALMV